MSNISKALVLLVVIMLIGGGLVVWKNKVGGHSSESFNSISRAEIEMLLADAAKQNPMILKRLKEEPELKKQQLRSFKEIFAFASQAKKEGLLDLANNRQELDNIKAELTAVNYDKEINKDKGPMPPFGFITEEMINAYWAEGAPPEAPKGFFAGLKDKLSGGGHVETRTHEQEFQDFLNAKIEILKAGNPEMKDREISEEEKTQAKEIFAKIRIYRAEYDRKAAAGELPKEFIDKTNLQVKLQQVQFLARLYTEAKAESMKVTDEEVDAYIASKPEYSPDAKRAKAQEILNRAKAGEDFVALANEFSEDPGNKGADGQPQGGIYKDVPKGRMVAPFETAALGLEPGQVAPELVPTDFGFHIIKLERKLGPSASKEGDGKTETYDVRHILISTNITDPESPNSRPMPVKDFVRAKLEKEKGEKLVEKLIADNNVQVPDDFTVPEFTPEMMEQMQKRQQQMQQMPGAPGGPGGPPAPEPGKPDAKKPEAPKKEEPKKK